MCTYNLCNLCRRDMEEQFEMGDRKMKRKQQKRSKTNPYWVNIENMSQQIL